MIRLARKVRDGGVQRRRQSGVGGLRCGFSALALLLLAAGCSTGWMPSPVRRPSEAERLVARADTLAETGWEHAARALYERVVREYPRDPATASALYTLGHLQADPASGFRNYRAAHDAFSRLLTDFPTSRWEAEARAWRATLSDLLAREEEAVRLRALLQSREEEASRLKVQLQSREEEAFGLKAQLQQLKRVDLEFERRR
jgi:Outer membrane lipoprotein